MFLGSATLRGAAGRRDAAPRGKAHCL